MKRAHGALQQEIVALLGSRANSCGSPFLSSKEIAAIVTASDPPSATGLRNVRRALRRLVETDPPIIVHREGVNGAPSGWALAGAPFDRSG